MEAITSNEFLNSVLEAEAWDGIIRESCIYRGNA